jgi:hypothetical protein
LFDVLVNEAANETDKPKKHQPKTFSDRKQPVSTRILCGVHRPQITKVVISQFRKVNSDGLKRHNDWNLNGEGYSFV